MQRLAQALKIRPGEERTVLRILALMLVAWSGAAIGSSAVESLFFARFGPRNLPYMYMAVGVVTFPITLGMGALLGRGSVQRVLVVLLFALALVVAALRGLLLLDGRWVYPPLWLGMMVAWTALGIVTWGLAGSVHDTRQAKRLFPLYGAGAILGGAVGGLLTAPLASLMGAENLLLVWAVSLGGAFLLAVSVGGPARPRRRRLAGPRPKPTRLLDAAFQGAQFVRRSPLALWMSVAIVLLNLLYFALTLPFAKAATERFTDPDSLAGFLGLFTGATYGVALLVSLGLANRLFARLGVPTAVLTYSVIFLIGFVVLAMAPGFAPIVAFRFVQWVWMYGVWTTGWQALRGVIPAEWREQVRSFMDGGPMQLGVVLAGVLLLVTQDTLSARQSYIAAAVLAVAAVWASWLIRRSYTGALVEALRSGRPEVFVAEEDPFGGAMLDRAVTSTLEEGVTDPDPFVRRVSMEVLATLPEPAVVEVPVENLEDEDPAVRLSALRLLERSRNRAAITPALALLDDPDPVVRASAADVAATLSDGDDEVVGRLRALMADPHVAVRIRAAAGLARASGDPEARGILAASARSSILEGRAAALTALGELGVEPSLVVAALQDDDPDVRRAAARALPGFGPATAVDPLLAALREDDPGVREAVSRALVALGGDVTPGLAEALNDGRSEATALATLVRLPNPDPTILRPYAVRERDEALRYHGAWQSLIGIEDDRVALLVSGLRHRAVRHAEHAVHALAPFGDLAAVEVALEDLGGRDANQRANAVETLETLVEPALVRPLVAVWEPQAAPRPGGAEVVRSLLGEDDPWIRACAAFAAGAFEAGDLLREVEALARDDPDPTVRESAGRTLGGEASVETISTLSVMDRVLLLGRVPLFRELSPADLKRVAESVAENAYVDGTVMAEQGDPGDAMHVVVSGDVRVMMGEETVAEVARRGPGYIVGEMAIVGEQPRMASLVAAGDVRTLSIDRKRFQRILRERPDAALAVMRELVSRLQEVHRGQVRT